MRSSVFSSILLASLLALSGGAALSARQAAAPAAALSPAQIEAMLEPRVGDHPDLGIVVGLIDAAGKRTVVSVGSAGEGTVPPLDGDTVFEIKSISKVFTSTLLADIEFLAICQLGHPVGETYDYSNLGAGLCHHLPAPVRSDPRPTTC
jgi:CubicO group peptidase (beta-lactamase class C family)